MHRLRFASPLLVALGAVVLMVACEVRVGDPNPSVTAGTGAAGTTSGTGATRPVGSGSNGQGGDPTRTEAVVTVGTGATGQGGSGSSGGAGGESQGSGGAAIYQCQTDSVCDIKDDCVCPDCTNYVVCSNPANCTDDGICKPFLEGCQCADCAALDICQP